MQPTPVGIFNSVSLALRFGACCLSFVRAVKILIRNLALLGCSILLASSVAAQELAAFHIPNQARIYLFNLPSSTFSTNPAPSGVEGTVTILASHFTTTNQTGFVTIIFQDAVVCWPSSPTGKQWGASTAIFGDYPVSYPSSTRVHVCGDFIRLADLSEKSFELPSPSDNAHTKTYTGEEAIKRLREMGLKPPEDMDWEKATNK